MDFVKSHLQESADLEKKWAKIGSTGQSFIFLSDFLQIHILAV